MIDEFRLSDVDGVEEVLVGGSESEEGSCGLNPTREGPTYPVGKRAARKSVSGLVGCLRVLADEVSEKNRDMDVGREKRDKGWWV
ncbi:MAG: hypothetical protein J2P37_35750, partial [Ktedonobacteraceae bacterium]|nr:hypothetical protein [Ktedonobacteraceae bacterium]